ncbi:MAG: HNH endonuclease signature motif containing protein [Nocardioides sp.]
MHQLPHTLVALEAGVLSEHRAQILPPRPRTSPRPTGPGWMPRSAPTTTASVVGNRRLESEVKRAAYRADPQAAVSRAAYAERARSVSIRPAPDTMVWLTALLPVAAGVSCYAALSAAADTARAGGDRRARGQVMADTLVERLSGRAQATGVPVQVSLVMTDRALLAAGDEPAHVDGYGPIAAQLARQLVAGADRAWLRRLYTAPETGQLVAMDSRSRFFPAGLAAFIRARDQQCRTPWCDAPIRHLDHVVPITAGGRTTRDGGQGLCEGCNYAKRAFGWRAALIRADGRAGAHRVATTTPTGHTYTSRAPDPPGSPPRRAPRVDWLVAGPEVGWAA